MNNIPKKFFGYGENCITFWALKTCLNEILTEEDKENINDCVRILFPSFGRGGRSKKLFGEFDAIVISKRHIYLIESKWDGSGNKEKILKDISEQSKRHKIFYVYFKNWINITKHGGNSKWEQFLKNVEVDIKNEFPDKASVSSGNLLAENLKFVLDKFSELNQINDQSNNKEKIIRNVLLYFYDSGNSQPLESEEIKQLGFDIKNIDYHPIADNNFVVLD